MKSFLTWTIFSFCFSQKYTVKSHIKFLIVAWYSCPTFIGKCFSVPWHLNISRWTIITQVVNVISVTWIARIYHNNIMLSCWMVAVIFANCLCPEGSILTRFTQSPYIRHVSFKNYLAFSFNFFSMLSIHLQWM